MTSSAMADEPKTPLDKNISKQLATCAAYFYYEGYVKDKESSRNSFDSIVEGDKKKAGKAFNKAVLYGGNEYTLS